MSSFEKAFIEQGRKMSSHVLRLYSQGISVQDIVDITKYSLQFVLDSIADYTGEAPQNNVPAVP